MDADGREQAEVQPHEVDPSGQDNARLGYEVAVSLMSTEGNLIWNRYGLMLVAQSVILTGIGMTTNASSSMRTVIILGLSLVGLVLCGVWWIVHDIGFRYYFYWLCSARELEELYLAPIKTLRRGTFLRRGARVVVVLDGKEETLDLGGRDRIRVVHVSKLVIVIFGILYFSLLTFLAASLLIG